jgi:exodeoxyribonuclease VII small subunit
MAEKKHKDDVSKLNFEDSIKQLKAIVEQIEQGEIPLQDSLDQYEKGMTLIKHCRTILQQAEERIEKISREEAAEESGEKDRAPEANEEDAEEGLF